VHNDRYSGHTRQLVICVVLKMTTANYQTYAQARAIAITIAAVIKLSSAQVLAGLRPLLSLCMRSSAKRERMVRSGTAQRHHPRFPALLRLAPKAD